jgi:hypothetical protein
MAKYIGAPERLVLNMHWEVEPGSADMESLSLFLRMVDGRYEVERLEAAGSADGYLDLEMVRRYNYRPTLVRALTSHFEHLMRRITDPAERFVYTYLLAKLTGDNPTKAVAEELGISVDAAAQRVRRARQLDPPVLPPATPTRKAR